MPAPYNVICSPRIKINTFAYSEVNEKKKNVPDIPFAPFSDSREITNSL